MNFGELKTAILSDAHRADLAAEVPRFVRLCEGLIRRDLRAYLLRTTLTDSDRSSGAIYNVPGRLLDVRSIHLQGRQGDGLARVMPGHIRRLDETADPIQYCQYGDGTIEFRGTPSATHVFDLAYFGTPAPLDLDTDTNDLLTDHEGLYMAGASMYLYLHTQDKELAEDQGNIFSSIIETLNEQFARQISGGGQAPLYNTSSRSAY